MKPEVVETMIAFAIHEVSSRDAPPHSKMLSGLLMVMILFAVAMLLLCQKTYTQVLDDIW